MARVGFGRLIVVMAILLRAGTVLAQPYAVPAHSIAAGGSGSAGDYVLDGTIGQAAAGAQMSGGAFTIVGGFWSGFASLPFTDHPLLAGITPVRALHVNELRSRINALRSRFGLTAYSYTGVSVSAGIVVQAQHVLELRTALGEAYAAAKRTAPIYSVPGPQVGTAVRAVHIAEIRAAVIAIE